MSLMTRLLLSRYLFEYPFPSSQCSNLLEVSSLPLSSSYSFLILSFVLHLIPLYQELPYTGKSFNHKKKGMKLLGFNDSSRLLPVFLYTSYACFWLASHIREHIPGPLHTVTFTIFLINTCFGASVRSVNNFPFFVDATCFTMHITFWMIAR